MSNGVQFLNAKRKVAEAGFEPAQGYSPRRILSPVCLPIPPLSRERKSLFYDLRCLPA